MAQDTNMEGDGHAAIEQMLPWYLNGTLSEAETASVEAHLSACPACRAQLGGEESLAQSVKAIDLARGRAWAAMEKRLGASPRARAPWYRRPVPLGWAVATPLLAASLAAAIMVMPGGPGAPVPRREPVYIALGAAGGERAGNIILQFRDGATAADIRRVVESVDARLVDGPTVTGAFLLHVAPAGRGEALKRLTAAGAVSFAQPIDPVEPQ